jgi:hypothetical protein
LRLDNNGSRIQAAGLKLGRHLFITERAGAPIDRLFRPLRGLLDLLADPTACAVGYGLPPAFAGLFSTFKDGSRVSFY